MNYPSATVLNSGVGRYQIWKMVNGAIVDDDGNPFEILHTFAEGTTNDEACTATTVYQNTGVLPE